MTCRIAVVGAGRMGKLHARVLSEMPGVELACVVDANPAVARTLGRQRDCPARTDVRKAVDQADAAIIATPTVAHLDAARPFVAAGKHVLIEKPLTDDPDAAAELLAEARRTGAHVQVGQTERFNPVALAMRRYAIRPKFIEAHRISPFTFRSADVGVVLDVMIHDIDLVRMLAAAPVNDVQAVGVNVIGAHEDICNARLRFESGCVANLTASRLAIKTERKMRIFSEEAYLSVDYGRKVGVVIQKSRNLDLIQMAREMDVDDIAELSESVDYTKLLHVEQLAVDESIEPLRKQAEAFVETATRGTPPAVPAADGLAAVRIAHQIVRQIKEYAWDGPASARRGLDIIRKDEGTGGA